MSSNVINQTPYLRTTRNFPNDIDLLIVELSKSYIDTSNAVNNRTISAFPTVRPTVNGENWFFGGKKYQGLRQVYEISSTGTVAHNVDTSSIQAFTKIYGTFTDGTLWYPLPYVDVTSVTDQIQLTVDSSNINITGGGGGGQPNITSGFVVLEWISRTSTNLSV